MTTFDSTSPAPWSRLALALGFGLTLLATPSLGHAQELPLCFGGSASVGAAVTLDRRVSTADDCRYGLSPSGPFTALTGEARPITAVLQQLRWEPGQASTVYARRGDEARVVSSIFVDHCTDYVLQPGGAFTVAPGADAGVVVVRRASSSCGAARMALRFECSTRGVADQRLPTGRPSVSLPACPSGYLVEAEAAGAPAYALGRLAAGSQTPLQAYFAQGDEGPSPLLRADFEAGPRGLMLVPAGDASRLWDELRTALAAGAAHLVRAAVGEGRVCESGEEIPITVTAAGLRFDESYLAGLLTAAHGSAGGRIAPSHELWQRLAGSLSFCLDRSYGARGAQGVRQRVFQDVVDTAALRPADGAEVCVTHARVLVTPRGATVEQGGQRQCVDAGAGGVLLAVAGAELQTPSGTLLCRGDTALAQNDDWRYTLERGFYDVRVATQGGCASQATASLARVGVVAPGHDWVPMGVRRLGGGVDHDTIPAWRGMRADGPLRFGLKRGSDELEFRMNSPEGVAEVWNDPNSGRASVVSRFAPDTDGDERDFGHAGPPAFSTRITGGAGCPLDDPDAEPVGSRGLPVDRVVYAHLVLNDGEQARCVARATFRSWEARVLASVPGSARAQLRFGVLGDVQLGVFISKPEPGAFGVTVPLAYLDLHLPAGFVVETSLPFTSAIAWDDGGGSRVGVGFMTSISWGYPSVAPRLLTAGFILHAPWPHADDEVYSFFFGIDVSSMVDLVGGR